MTVALDRRPLLGTVLNQEPEVAKRELSAPRSLRQEREMSLLQCGLEENYLAPYQLFS